MNDPMAVDLATWLPQAWNLHADRPHDVAAGLQARQPTLGGDANAAEAVRLAEHVWLSHLGDEAGLQAWLQQLPAAVTQGPASAASVQRTRWVLALLDGSPAPAVDDAARWRGMQNLWSVWAAHGRAHDALAMLATEAPRALADPDPATCRALAATCNNLAAELRAGRRGDTTIDTLMLALARASRQLWPRAGTWVHVERADYELARCHAVLGQGDAALAHARACLAAIDAHAGEAEASAMEYFYAHEALAWACRAAGDAAGVAAQRQHMLDRLVAIDDAHTRAWCQRDLADLERALT
jgi:hypothetical protein